MYYTLYAYENSSTSTSRSLFAHATGLSRNHAESLHEFYSDMERIILTEIVSDDGGTFISRDINHDGARSATTVNTLDDFLDSDLTLL